ncbi:MAG: hypothetical protein ACFCUI_09830 [Bernardetiaceae bacterium]
MNYRIHLLCLWITLCTYALEGQPNPSASLMDYIGLARQEAALKMWVQQLGLPDRQLSNEHSLTFPERGIRLGFFRKQWLDKIMLYSNEKSFTAYTGQLPLGLRFGQSKSAVMAQVGHLPYREYSNILEYNHLSANLVLFFDGSRMQAVLEKVLIRYKSCQSGNCQDGEGIYQDLAGNRYEGDWRDGKQHGNGKMRFADGNTKEGVWDKGNYMGPNFFKAHELYDLLGKHQSNHIFDQLRKAYPDSVQEIQLAYDYFKQILDRGNIKLYFNDYGYLYKMDIHSNRLKDFADDLMSRLSSAKDQRFVAYALGPPTLEKKVRGRQIWYYEKPPYAFRLEFDRDQRLHDIEVKIADAIFDDLVGRCMSGNCQNGFGEALSESGRYIGSFKEGKFNGKGTYYYKKGGVYKGDFKDNFREGQGIYVWSDQSFYDGQWQNNQRSGTGIMKYADEGKYIGTWQNNRRHGKGTMYYPNGDRYEGDWKFGQPNGFGTMFYKDHKEYGVWMDGFLRQKL